MQNVSPSLPTPDPHIAVFAALLRIRSEDALFLRALQISALVHPEFAPGWAKPWRQQYLLLVNEASAAVPAEGPVVERYRALCSFFFGQCGFGPDTESYDDPRNSALCDVLKRRLGIPISLAVLLMELGRTLRIPVLGIGAPGHFLVGIEDEEGMRHFGDVFDGGRLFGREEARERVRRAVGSVSDPFCDHLLRPASDHDIIARMINNLKGVWAAQGNARRLLVAYDWLLLVQPANIAEIRNRGLLLLRTGDIERGMRDLGCYLAGAPDAPDAEMIQEELVRAQLLRARLN
jgi:regulator of sirC expression with transglutaminase-like and TPR domain